MLRSFILLLLFILTPNLKAQHEDVLSQYLSSLSTEETFESGYIEQLSEQLSMLALQPKNINTATREDFEQFPFLNEGEIESLCAYLYQYAPMRTFGELAMIPELDDMSRKLIPVFFFIGDMQQDKRNLLKDAIKYGHHELTFTARIPFYQRRGDKEGYKGYPYKHSLRYNFNYANRLRFGFIGSQDAGEPFFGKYNKIGYDHYSAYLQLKDFGLIKNAVVGHYRIRLGQGIVFNNNFEMGKLVQLSNITRTSVAITPHASRSESNYLQGAALTIGFTKHLDITLFGSIRHIDATLTTDGLNIQTIRSDGYHRTVSELDKKNNSTESIAGGHLSYNSGTGWTIGLSGVYNSFDKPLLPLQTQEYRRWYATGNHFSNFSIDYSYRSYRLSFAGETATSSSSALASLNTLCWRPANDIQVFAAYRFYGYKYNAIHAEAFNEGGYVQNESGFYVGINMQPFRKWTVTAYTDYVYFPWDKYGADGSSKGWDNLLQATYRNGDYLFSARYRFKMRELNNADKSRLIWRKEHRSRISADYSFYTFSLRSQVDVNYYTHIKNSLGWMLSQQASTEIRKNVTLSATLAYFQTADYYSRVYLYERGPLYSMSFPSYFYKGVHCGLFVKAGMIKNLTATARFGATRYFNRDVIGSGLQTVNKKMITDLDIQIRWKF